MVTRRPKKKKSSNGVWIGTGISLAILSLICVAFYFKLQPPPADSLSGGITETNLAKQTLQTDGLPDLGQAPAGSGSLETLFDAIADGKLILRSPGYETEKTAKAHAIVQALYGAANSSFPTNAFDARIPEKAYQSHDLKDDLKALGIAVRNQIDQHLGQDQFHQARGIALSHLALGQQVFEKNIRLKSRQRGLAMMQSALSHLGRINSARYETGKIDEDELANANKAITPWFNAIKAVNDVWDSKLATTQSVNQSKRIPNTADLVKIANEDQDRTFRIFAALRLGHALYERGDQKNQEVIKAAIETLKADSDKLVAAAAAAGESIADTDEYYELNK